MGDYTTATDVANFLQTDITSGTTPSLSTVDDWIDWSESRIDRKSGYSYTTSQTSALIIKGIGVRAFWLDKEYLPLVSVSSMEVNVGSDYDLDWVSKTEGTDFLITDLDSGAFQFNSDVSGFSNKINQLRITFIQGFSSVPGVVNELATKLSAQKFLKSVMSATSAGGNESIRVGPIKIDDGTRNSVLFMENLSSDIKELFDELGTLKSYIY